MESNQSKNIVGHLLRVYLKLLPDYQAKQIVTKHIGSSARYHWGNRNQNIDLNINHDTS